MTGPCYGGRTKGALDTGASRGSSSTRRGTLRLAADYLRPRPPVLYWTRWRAHGIASSRSSGTGSPDTSQMP